MPDLGQIQIRRVILHDVPRKSDLSAMKAVRFSETDSPLSDELRLLLRNKLVEGCAVRGSFAAFVDEDLSSPIGAAVESLVKDSTKLLESSQIIAAHLYECQPKVSPPGLVAIIDCTVEDVPSVAVMKLEREEGIELQEVERDGKRAFDLEHLQNLIVTSKTKLQKLGLFTRDAKTNEPWLRVCDRQRGFDPNTEVADYFLTRFLGARLVAGDPPVATARVFEATEAFINDHVTDPERKGQYAAALATELNNNLAVMNPTAFASANFATEDRAPYLAALEKADLPVDSFDKDVSTIRTRLKRVYVQLSNKVIVSAPEADFDEVLEINSLDDGRAEIKSTGFISRVGR